MCICECLGEIFVTTLTHSSLSIIITYFQTMTGRSHICQPLVDKPWTLFRPTKLYSARDTCMNIKPHWSVKLINISFEKKTAIKIYFQLFNWKICQKIPINWPFIPIVTGMESMSCVLFEEFYMWVSLICKRKPHDNYCIFNEFLIDYTHIVIFK